MAPQHTMDDKNTIRVPEEFMERYNVTQKDLDSWTFNRSCGRFIFCDDAKFMIRELSGINGRAK